MANVGELIANIKLNGVADVEKKLSGVSKKMDSVGKKVGSAGDKLTRAGAKMSVATAPLSAGLAKSAQEAIKFEDDFSGVRKTVDGSEKYFNQLKDSIVDMSKQAPTSANELANIAETAGQLGIENDAIADFSRTIADISTATNMTSEQASRDMAVLAQITGMPQDKFENLGSSIVDLGNSLPTTESEIMALGQRMASTADLVGMSETDIMGLSATMTALGINAEEGGSSMRNILSKINTAVKEGGADLEVFAKHAGVSSEEFANTWENKPMDALQTLAEGLGEAGASGDDMSAILEDLGMTGLRESNVMQLLAGNTDMLSESVDKSNTAFKENTALSNEAEQKYETLSSKFKILKNNIQALAMEVGEILMPAIEKLVDKGIQLSEWLSNLDDNTKKWAVGIGLVAVKLPVLVTGLGLLLKAVSSGIMGFVTFGRTIKKIVKALISVGKSVKKFGGTVAKIVVRVISYFGRMKGAITVALRGIMMLFKANPWMLLITGLITVGTLIYKHWDSIVAFTKNIWNSLKAWFAPYWDSFVQLVAQAVTWIMAKWNSFKSWFVNLITTAVTGAITAWTAFRTAISTVVAWVQAKWQSFKVMFITIITTAIQTGISIWQTLKASISSIWNGIVTVVQTSFNIIKNIIMVAVGVILTILSPIYNTFVTIWNGAVDVVTWAVNMVKSIVRTMINTIISVLNSIRQKFLEIWNMIYSSIVKPVIDKIITSAKRIYSNIVSVLTSVRNFFVTTWNSIVQTVSSFVDMIIQRVLIMYNRIKGHVRRIYLIFKQYWNQIYSSVIQPVIDMIVNYLNRVKDGAIRIMNMVKNAFTTAWNFIKSIVSSVIQTIISILQNMYSRASSIANNIRSAFVDAWNRIKSMVSSAIDAIIGFVQNLYDRAVDIASSIYDSFASAWGDIESTATGAVDGIIGKVQDLWNTAKGIASDLKDAFSNIFSNIKVPSFSMGGWTPSDLPKLPKLSVNWNASGGILDSATFIGAGEKGTESIVPLSSQRKMKPFAQAVGRFMDTGDEGGTEGGSSTNEQTVVSVQVDGRELARATAEHMDNNLRGRADSKLRARGGYR